MRPAAPLTAATIPSLLWWTVLSEWEPEEALPSVICGRYCVTEEQ